MLELLTATGLATAAGLNAALPLLVLSVLARWTPLVELSEGWTWLTDGWAIAVLVVLLLVEVVADKIPGVDHLNDVLQSVLRPAAGGVAFSAGVGAQTMAVPATVEGTTTGQWLAVLAGVVLSLTVHVAKALLRVGVNTSTGGLGGPVVSGIEDILSVLLSLAAVLVPALVLVGLFVLGWLAVRTLRRRARRRVPAPPRPA
ncbi:DUF4126 domain-containing protein [Actinotalea sp. K2]|uniref:DUF4126 domain-containing protein n=1 Tax=Actinotalea sp. K2 TaxID=2939438 RepID=UPI002016FFB7|nr:DUF4126 domain-containing protein [Actinotalea sp. K2]MCL3862411.1 DUF4126 domain-containing protein [Actinotalea sp. K2]